MLSTSIEFLKGVGPSKYRLLKEDLGISIFNDLLHYYPFRYIDRSKIYSIDSLHPEMNAVMIKGKIIHVKEEGGERKKRLKAILEDETGRIDLVWFRGMSYMQKQLAIGAQYLVFGKPNLFLSKLNIAHPEIEWATPDAMKKLKGFAPVYSTSEKLAKRGLDAKGLRKIVRNLMQKLDGYTFEDILPQDIQTRWKLLPRNRAMRFIHFPPNHYRLKQAENTIKFEELFLYQYRLLYLNHNRKAISKGALFAEVGSQFMEFYQNKLTFELTSAQKRVMKEIRQDLKSGQQMNRLLQGDVGSGKTIVALLCMLLAVDNGHQACLLAPTEILAQQHYQSISEYLSGFDIQLAFLSGSVKGKTRAQILSRLADGTIDLIIGTHALLEDPVIFANLGLAITDEQHRFGVKQRAKLWLKNENLAPHILVMTATPIPRTLAMTHYGDLDISVIDELPPGRKPVETRHWFESKRLLLMGFLKKQLEQGRQVYIVYPMIEENETLDLANLTEGFEAVQRVFGPDGYHVGVVHGKMKPEAKDFEMERFAKHETHILVATTVIEVGVNVPNASVMVIENTERFGLSQLHQLRGRVGRGASQSFCILMSGYKLSKEAKRRINIMCETNDGFLIAQEDMKIRGPGMIDGTQQSGIASLHLSNLVTDEKILVAAREEAKKLIERDPELMQPSHQRLKKELTKGVNRIDWKDIS